MTTKEDLKQEIGKLDGNCLDLALRLLQQITYQPQSKHDPLSCSRPINYPRAETSDGLAFTDLEDAAAFGKQLRTSAWQRNPHL